jgi:hypothetical protein
MPPTPTSPSPIVAPPGWGTDSLSTYFDQMKNNLFGGFVNFKHRYAQLSEIDACFCTVLTGWINPKNHISAGLFYRSHSAFRVAAGQSLAGQATEAYSVMRMCLETASYGLLIHTNPQLGEIWLRRHDSPAAKAQSIGKFSAAELKKAIAPHDGRLVEVYDELYQRAVDFGAHPNERAITGAAHMEETLTGIDVTHVYLHGNGLALQQAIKTTAQIGVCSLHIFQHAYTPRFSLLGVKDRLAVLRSQDP